jgi:hypothetical protein
MAGFSNIELIDLSRLEIIARLQQLEEFRNPDTMRTIIQSLLSCIRSTETERHRIFPFTR